MNTADKKTETYCAEAIYPLGDSVSTRVVRGSLWSLSGQITALLTSFVTTPIIIRMLGTAHYGLLTLVTVTIGYLIFVDLGMGVASTKFGAEAVAQGDRKAESSVIWTSLAVLALPSLLAAGMLFLGADALVLRFFRLPTQFHSEAASAFRIASLAVIMTAMSSTLNTPQIARVRINISTSITTGCSILQAVASITALWFGCGLTTLVAIVSTVALLGALVNGIVSTRLCPELLHPGINRQLVKPLLVFGMGFLAMAAIGALLINGEKFLLVQLGSPSTLAYYNVAFTLASLLGFLPSAILQPLLPSFVHLQALSDRAGQERLYSAVLRAMMLCELPAALIMCVAARTFFTLWAGPAYGRESVGPFFALVVGWLFYAACLIPRNILTAMGKLGTVSRCQALTLLPYFPVAFLLIRKYGALGAGLGWSLRVIAECLLMIRAVYVSAGLRPSLLPAKRRVFILALAVLFLPVSLTPMAGLRFPAILAITILSIGIYGIFVIRKILNDQERNLLLSFLPKILRIGNRRQSSE